MLITNIEHREIARRHSHYFMICRQCGARNPWQATKCRSRNLRAKKREITRWVKKEFAYECIGTDLNQPPPHAPYLNAKKMLIPIHQNSVNSAKVMKLNKKLGSGGKWPRVFGVENRYGSTVRKDGFTQTVNRTRKERRGQTITVHCPREMNISGMDKWE